MNTVGRTRNRCNGALSKYRPIAFSRIAIRSSTLEGCRSESS